MNLGDSDREKIIDAYADGQDAADIGRQYGLTSRDIERIVAGDTELEALAAPRGRAPAPVLAAVVVVVLYGTVQLAEIANNPDLGGLLFKLPALAIGALVYALVSYGIWRGFRVAQWIGGLGGLLAVIGGAVLADQRDDLAILGGALLVGLLVAPEQTREWFARR